MAVDYAARKAAKKQRRRIASGPTKSKSDGAAGGEGGSGKDKKQRPKRGRSGPRRLCQGMCFQVPKLSDDDIAWRSNDDDGERGAKVYDPRAPPPPREAELAAAAAARVLESGAADAREILEKVDNGSGCGASRKRNRRRARVEAAEAPSTPAARRRRLSTGAAVGSFDGGGAGASPSSRPTLDREFDPSTLPLSLRMLAAACGLEAPTRVQSSAWAVATGGGEGSAPSGCKNLLIVAPPGAGKTLAYLLPAAAKVVAEQDSDGDGDDGRRRRPAGGSPSAKGSSSLPSPGVLVLVPTRELARQVAAAARPLRKAAGVRVARVAGGDRREDQVDRLRGGGGVHVLVATPGRLLDLVRGGDVGLASTHTVVLDEADKMLASSGLREQLDEVRGIVRSQAEAPQRVLASATMPSSVAGLASSWLGEERGRDYLVVYADGRAPASTSPSPSVTQVVTVCAEHKKPAKLLRHLSRVRAASSAAGERHAPRVLVFANRIKTVKFVADLLRREERKEREKKGEDGGERKRKAPFSKIETLHGERTQPERDAALAAFRAGKATVLVATDVAARGLDVAGLRHVVNYDFPSSVDGYEHRVGRAGRDGLGGHVASFFCRPAAAMARGVVGFLERCGQGVDPNLVRLAEAYDEARRRMEVGGGGEGGGGSDDEGDERSRRAAAAKEAARESKGGGKRRERKREAAEEEEVEEDDDEEEERRPAQLGLYRKAAAKTATARAASPDANKSRDPKKKKAVPGRLRKKLKREAEEGGRL